MITLECNYSKKIGLPGFSSHQFSVSLKCELNDLSQVQGESSRLYEMLQSTVDRELQTTGFLPNSPNSKPIHSNGNGNGNGNGHSEVWKCSPRQKELILKLVEENQIEKQEIEQLAQDRFGKGVKALNKLEASGLIDELLEQYPSKPTPHRNGRGHPPVRAK
jgi:hypothetical protein